MTAITQGRTNSLLSPIPLLSERIAQTGGKSSGFDYLRIGLALVILCFHSIVTSYGKSGQDAFFEHPASVLVTALLPMFFALSGFLVSGSLERSKSLSVFLGLRMLRIFPALAVDTLLCALVLGPWLTTLSWQDYFSHPQFHQYLLNTLGLIHFHLPGVFEHNPMSEVNGQLWTVPSELECYIALTLLALLSLHQRRGVFLGLFTLVLLAQQWRVMVGGVQPWTGRLLLLSFLAGVLCFQWRDRIRWHAGLAALSAAALLATLAHDSLYYLSVVPATYLTVYLGLCHPRKSQWLNSGDYSYGLFLYGFPIQQTVVALVPAAQADWYINLLISAPLALLFAVLSWHLFEKRALGYKHWLFAARARLPERPAFFRPSARSPITSA